MVFAMASAVSHFCLFLCAICNSLESLTFVLYSAIYFFDVSGQSIFFAPTYILKFEVF